MSGDLNRLQEMLSEQYATWRTDPNVDRNDPTAIFVADLAQHLIALVAIQQGLERRELRRARLT